MKIDSNLNLLVLLGDENDVGYPVRVLFFLDEIRVYKFF